MDLTHLSDALDSARSLAVRNRILLDSVDSTNDVGLRLVRQCLDGRQTLPRAVIIALHQKAGRGRLGRPWVSPRARGAYFSTVVSTSGPSDAASLPLLVALGLCRKLSDLSESPCRLKWPNDLMIGKRKLGGILIDGVSRGSNSFGAVIGVGVNYSSSEALTRVGGISLQEVARQPPRLETVIAELVISVEEELTHMGDLVYAAEGYRRLSAHRPGDPLQFRTTEGIRGGEFVKLDERGFLVLQGCGGEIRLSAGEAIEEGTGGRHKS